MTRAAPWLAVIAIILSGFAIGQRFQPEVDLQEVVRREVDQELTRREKDLVRRIAPIVQRITEDFGAPYARRIETLNDVSDALFGAFDLLGATSSEP